MGREDILAVKCKYLRVIERNRKSSIPRPEMYTGETWVNQNECMQKCWTASDGVVGRKLKIPVYNIACRWRARVCARGTSNV